MRVLRSLKGVNQKDDVILECMKNYIVLYVNDVKFVSERFCVVEKCIY